MLILVHIPWSCLSSESAYSIFEALRPKILITCMSGDGVTTWMGTYITRLIFIKQAHFAIMTLSASIATIASEHIFTGFLIMAAYRMG